MNFTELDLAEPIQKAIKEFDFEELTEVQQEAIPLLQQQRDITILSQTGSGKTFSFLIPLIDRMLREDWPKDQLGLMVVVPTRELALQLAEEAQKLVKYTELRAEAFFGGTDIQRHIKLMKQGVSIAVFTPGRLIDCIDRKNQDFSKIPYLVVDEADRLFDMGFIDDIKYILKQLRGLKQRVLASATLTADVLDMVDKYLNEPAKVEVNPEEMTVEQIEQWVYHLGSEEKKRFLVNYLKGIDYDMVMVFANTRDMVEDLSRLLQQNGFKAKGISSRLTQNVRTKLIKDYRENNFQILIATDVASRGLDIEGVSHIINYDMPNNTENYVHRIGRTARAGREGVAISLCSERDYDILHKVETFIGQKIEVGNVQEEHLVVVNEPAARNRRSRSQSGGNKTQRDRRSASKSRSQESKGKREGEARKAAPQAKQSAAGSRGGTGQGKRPADKGGKNKRSRKPMENDFQPPSIAQDEPMVTVYKRGHYIDPVEVKKELGRINTPKSTKGLQAAWRSLKGAVSQLVSGKKKAQVSEAQDKAEPDKDAAKEGKSQPESKKGRPPATAKKTNATQGKSRQPQRGSGKSQGNQGSQRNQGSKGTNKTGQGRASAQGKSASSGQGSSRSNKNGSSGKESQRGQGGQSNQGGKAQNKRGQSPKSRNNKSGNSPKSGGNANRSSASKKGGKGNQGPKQPRESGK